MTSRFSPKARRLLEEIGCAEDRAAGETLVREFDFDALDAEQREILKECVADLMHELPQ